MHSKYFLKNVQLLELLRNSFRLNWIEEGRRRRDRIVNLKSRKKNHFGMSSFQKKKMLGN